MACISAPRSPVRPGGGRRRTPSHRCEEPSHLCEGPAQHIEVGRARTWASDGRHNVVGQAARQRRTGRLGLPWGSASEPPQHRVRVAHAAHCDETVEHAGALVAIFDAEAHGLSAQSARLLEAAGQQRRADSPPPVLRRARPDRAEHRPRFVVEGDETEAADAYDGMLLARCHAAPLDVTEPAVDYFASLRRRLMSPSHTSGSNLRSAMRSFIGMIALSVMWMSSGHTSLQHLVMLQ